MTNYRVTIQGNEYTKSIIQGTLSVSTIYRMLRTNEKTGKKTLAVLDKQVHRRMIARIEAAIATQK
jgi:hypothetical protein